MGFGPRENNYMPKKDTEKSSEGGFELGLGGILKGLGDLVEDRLLCGAVEVLQ